MGCLFERTLRAAFGAKGFLPVARFRVRQQVKEIAVWLDWEEKKARISCRASTQRWQLKLPAGVLNFPLKFINLPPTSIETDLRSFEQEGKQDQHPVHNGRSLGKGNASLSLLEFLDLSFETTTVLFLPLRSDPWYSRGNLDHFA